MAINLENNGKRKPSKWQLYLKTCFSEQDNKDTPFSERVSACSVKYKEIKEKNPKYLDDLANKAELQKYQQKNMIPIPKSISKK